MGLNETTELAASFLENACADPLLANGPAAHARRSNTALRMLKRNPDDTATQRFCGVAGEGEDDAPPHPQSGGPSSQGMTAADYARKWALYDTADLLDSLTR